MESITNLEAFETTGILWKDISYKFEFYNINVIADVLNSRVQIEKYGNGVKELVFIFIAVLPNDKMHEEYTVYLPNEKKLVLHRKLPYHKVETYSKPEVLRLMAETYHLAIANLWEEQIPNFNYQLLEEDIQKIFIELGWLVSENYYPVSRLVRAETVATFLQSKGWKEKAKTEHYHIMTPPEKQPSLRDSLIYIPLSSNGSTDKYQRAWSDVILMISKIYEIDRLELELLFAKDKKEIRKNMELMAEMLNK